MMTMALDRWVGEMSESRTGCVVLGWGLHWRLSERERSLPVAWLRARGWDRGTVKAGLCPDELGVLSLYLGMVGMIIPIQIAREKGGRGRGQSHTHRS